MLEDLAVLTGGEVITSELGLDLKDTSIEQLGRARQVKCTKENTIIVDGMGDKAADGVVDAVKDGMFLSKEDFRNRTKVSKTICDLMADLGLLGELPESNQLSLFDFA